tara:strand:+ start:275 stop:649 length:375 start_codon:yes stop_codon:yes gene_type:complete
MSKTNKSWGGDTSFYRTKEWISIRDSKREDEPLCSACISVGVVEVGRFIDHILNMKLFPEYSTEPLNLQNLCFRDHQQKTALERQFKTRESYLKAFEDGKLQYICSKEAKENLLELITKNGYRN